MNQQRLKNIKEVFLRYQTILFPVSFVLSGLINFIFFYLGLAFEDNIVRQAGFIFCNIVFAICCGISFLYMICQKKMCWRQRILLAAIMLFFAVCYTVAFLRFGLQGQLISYAEKFIVLSIPAFLIGVSAALQQKESHFFETLESISVLAFPVGLIYFNSTLFDCLPWNYGANLGIINYMGIGYSLMPFLLAHIICFIEKREHWTIPFTNKQMPRPQLVRSIVITVYWIAIIASATRGALVCVAGFCILLAVLQLIKKQRTVRRTLKLSAVMAIVLLFLMFIYAPPGLYRIERATLFLDALKSGQLITSVDDSAVADHIDDMVQMSGGQQVTNKTSVSNGEKEDDKTEPAKDVDTDNNIEELKISNRGTYYKLAFKELQKNPLTGMGPLGFTVKYGTYPHSVVLEMFSDLGIIGASILLALIIGVIIKILLIGWKCMDILYLFVFLATFAIQANISGSLWNCATLLSALGYGIALTAPTFNSIENNNSDKEAID